MSSTCRRGEPDPRRDLLVRRLLHRLRAHVGPHREHSLEGAHDGLLLAGGEQVREIPDRDPKGADVREGAVHLDHPRLRGGLERREGRHVPHHRQGAGTPGAGGTPPASPWRGAQTGERAAASSQASGMPSRRACVCTSGSVGSRNTSSCSWYRRVSSFTLAAASIRSAS